MDPLAAAFWGGFCTVAAFMLAAAVGAALRGFHRLAAVGATYALVPALFVGAYLGLLPAGEPATQTRVMAHLTALGAAGLAAQLLLVLRGYRKPGADRQARLALLLSAVAVLGPSWLMPPRPGLWLASAYAAALGLSLVGLALRKALGGNRTAWLSVAGVSLALVSLGSLGWIAGQGGAAPVATRAARQG